MTYKSSNIVANLRAALHSALRFVEQRTARAQDAASRAEGAVNPAGAETRAQTHSDGAAIASASRAGPQGRNDTHGQPSVDVLQGQLDLLAEHFAEQERKLAGLGGETHHPAALQAAAAAQLDAIKKRVRQRRARIATRTATQIRSARHVETRAQRLEDLLVHVGERRTKLLELELAVAHADTALVGYQVELADATSQLAAQERELTQCTTECARLCEPAGAPGAARNVADARVARTRSRLEQLRTQAGRLDMLDLRARSGEGSEEALPLDDALACWSTAADELADCLAHSATPPRKKRPELHIEEETLRAPLQRRLRLLDALSEIRVEETELLHAAQTDERAGSQASLARVASVRIRLSLDEVERAWLIEALQAVGQEQIARLSQTEDSAAAGSALAQAVASWRRCDRKLEEAAVRARAAHLTLATLRSALTPALGDANAESRELGTRVRERQSALRSRTRSIERVASRLRLTRGRSRALETRLRRGRRELERAHAQVDSPWLAGVLASLAALEREVETAAAMMAGVSEAHERSARALAAMEQALLELVSLRLVAPVPVTAEPGDVEAPWARARMEIDIADIADELERWKTRHAQLERRVEAQDRLLDAVVESHREDQALAELRLEMEHARRSAAASLERALALTTTEPSAGKRLGHDSPKR